MAATDSACPLDENKVVLVTPQWSEDESHKRFLVCSLDESTDGSEPLFNLKTTTVDSIPDPLRDRLIDHLPAYLQKNDGNIVDAVVSVRSGTGKALQFWNRVLVPLLHVAQYGKVDNGPPTAKLEIDGFDEVIITESDQSVRSYAKKLRAGTGKKSRTVVLLSGDGGVVDLLNGVDDDDRSAEDSALPLIALLPLGTGNALFHSYHKPLYSTDGPSPLVLALRTLFRGKPVDLPTFRVSFSPGSRIVTFKPASGTQGKDTGVGVDVDPAAQVSKREDAVSHLNGAIVASYGFHASIVYESDTPEYRVHGDKRFGMVAQELLRESHPYAATVEVRRPGSTGDFSPLRRDTHAYVLATMVSNLERTFTISPTSKPLDRSLRVVHFGPIGGERTMDVMMKAYDEGKHVGMKWDDGEEVGYEEVSAVRVVVKDEDERWRKVCIDGTIVDVPAGGQMVVEKAGQPLFKFLIDACVEPV